MSANTCKIVGISDAYRRDLLDITPRGDSFFLPYRDFTLLVDPESGGPDFLLSLKHKDLGRYNYGHFKMDGIHMLYTVDTLYRSMLNSWEFGITCDGGMARSSWGGRGRFIALPYMAVIDPHVGGVKFVPDRDAVAELDFSGSRRDDPEELIQPAREFLAEWDATDCGFEGKPGIWVEWERLEWLSRKHALAKSGECFSEHRDENHYHSDIRPSRRRRSFWQEYLRCTASSLARCIQIVENAERSKNKR